MVNKILFLLLVHVFVKHANNKIRVSKMTSFVYQFSIMSPRGRNSQ